VIAALSATRAVLATLLPLSTAALPNVREWLFGCGVVLVLAGLYLRWQLLDHSISTEERAKDGLLTEDQARLRLRVFRFSGPAVILLGVVAFAVVFTT
jgi:hypothetical protein